MGFVYIEYISRLPGVDLETFRAQAAQGQEGWDSGYEDELVLSVGRTWRLGPDPGYMTVWHMRNAGLDRIDAWDRIFRSGEADDLEQPFFQGRADRRGRLLRSTARTSPGPQRYLLRRVFRCPRHCGCRQELLREPGKTASRIHPQPPRPANRQAGSRTRRSGRLDHPRLRSAGFRGNRAGRSQRPDQAFRRRDLCRLRQGDPVRGPRFFRDFSKEASN